MSPRILIYCPDEGEGPDDAVEVSGDHLDEACKDEAERRDISGGGGFSDSRVMAARFAGQKEWQQFTVSAEMDVRYSVRDGE